MAELGRMILGVDRLGVEFGLSRYATELYEQVLPMHGPDPNGMARAYIGGIASMADEIDDLARDTADGPGWVTLLDVDLCPPKGLAWLAQLRGAVLRERTATESDGEWATYARAAIRLASARDRGTITAMTSAAQATLIGARTVLMTERPGGDAYALTARTYIPQTPDENVTRAALLSQKPAGIVLDYAAVSMSSWDAVSGEFASWDALALVDATWQDVS